MILPTLGPERRATYSPFLPISPLTGKVLQVPIVDRDVAGGTVALHGPRDRQARPRSRSRGGHCKLQWKADWAMRWAALGVDYEMAGKDLIDSVRLSGHICRILGGSSRKASSTSCFSTRRARRSRSRGQRPDHRGVADLRQPGEPGALHVSEPAQGEAALFRRHPARGRRIYRPSRRLSERGRRPRS